MKYLKTLLIIYLNSGARKSHSDELNKKISIIHLFALIGSSITGAMSIIAYSNKSFELAITLSIACAVLALAPIFQKLINNYLIVSSIVLYQLYFLMFYLIYTGGVSNTGPLWIFLIPPVTYFICGLKAGSFNLIIFVIITISILLLPTDAYSVNFYHDDFKLRLILSFITTSGLTALYEYSRETSYKSLQEITDKFEKLSKIDPLTQLSNRRDATNIIKYEQRRLIRNKTELSIIICDVDNFKKINDKNGHNIGDKVLVELAKIFQASVRTQDTVARWGGEEFLFILPYTNAKQAGVTALKVHKAISQSNPLCQTHPFDVTVSMGISTMAAADNIEATISKADKNLYKAKSAGKNRNIY